MKVYKFRSLHDDGSLKRSMDILESEKVWCSLFWEMNDPMEGYYQANRDFSKEIIDRIFAEKASTLICSFSRELAVRNPLMWGYYASGFNGIAIEFEVDPKLMLPVKYSNDFRSIDDADSIENNVRTILGRKIKCWSHEREMRFLDIEDYSGRERRVGKITGVIIGRTYPKALFNPDVGDRGERIHAYNERVRKVIQFVHGSVRLKWASMKSGKVLIEDFSPAEYNIH